MRTIDADALAWVLKHSKTYHKVIALDVVLDAVRCSPTIDAVSVVHGEWIPATWQDEQCPERLKRHKCSECGQRAKQILVRTELVDNYYCNKAAPITEYTHEEQLSKYCPNCGAKMKGADDE